MFQSFTINDNLALASAKFKELPQGSLALAAAGITFAYTVYRYNRLVRWQKETSKICPGPECHPLMGNISTMIECGGFSPELFERLHNDHGDIVRFYLGPTMCNVSINNPDMIHEMYKRVRDRPVETYLFLWFLGKEALVLQRGNPHTKDMRLRYGQMVQRREQLEAVDQVSRTRFKNLFDEITARSSNGKLAVDFNDDLVLTIYDIMGEVIFDGPWIPTKVGKECFDLHRSLIKGVDQWVLWPFPPLFHPTFCFYLYKIYKWRRLVGGLLDERREAIKTNPEAYKNNVSALSMIVTQRNADGTPFFTRTQEIASMQGFLNGAFDTTVATLYWALFFIAKDAKLQQRLFDEMTKYPNATFDDLRDNEFLDAFVWESLRMRATVPVNQRVNYSEDVTIGGYLIPKGTNINIPNCVMFKDERWVGPEPLEFRIERMLGSSPEVAKARKAVVAFGTQSRMCVGYNFANAEIKAMVYTLITNFTIALENPQDVGEVQLQSGISQPKTPAKFMFMKRN